MKVIRYNAESISIQREVSIWVELLEEVVKAETTTTFKLNLIRIMDTKCINMGQSRAGGTTADGAPGSALAS